MVLNYIGSKRTLASRIIAEFQKEWPDLSGTDFVDAFAGTGAIALAAAPHIRSLIVNDWEQFSVAVLKAQFNPPPNPLALINQLDQTLPTTGLITNTYSEQAGRMYFTTLNAQRIDGIREALRSPNYTPIERDYLRGSLVAAADTVANVASVYGAYLKEFKNTATNLLHLRVIPPSPRKATVLQMDTQQLAVDPAYISPETLLYLDPPYNQRQYGANYFPLNAVADIHADTLDVNGITGIPADGYKKSVWCSKKTVAQALKTVLEGTPARRLALSYNREGLLTHEEIGALFAATHWRFKRVEIPYKRFASQRDLEPNTTEYLFLAERE